MKKRKDLLIFTGALLAVLLLLWFFLKPKQSGVHGLVFGNLGSSGTLAPDRTEVANTGAAVRSGAVSGSADAGSPASGGATSGGTPNPQGSLSGVGGLTEAGGGGGSSIGARPPIDGGKDAGAAGGVPDSVQKQTDSNAGKPTDALPIAGGAGAAASGPEVTGSGATGPGSAGSAGPAGVGPGGTGGNGSAPGTAQGGAGTGASGSGNPAAGPGSSAGGSGSTPSGAQAGSATPASSVDAGAVGSPANGGQSGSGSAPGSASQAQGEGSSPSSAGAPSSAASPSASAARGIGTGSQGKSGAGPDGGFSNVKNTPDGSPEPAPEGVAKEKTGDLLQMAKNDAQPAALDTSSKTEDAASGGDRNAPKQDKPEPKDPQPFDPSHGTNIVFVLDRSLSMRQEDKSKIARHALVSALEALDKNKTFYVVFFPFKEMPAPGPMKATPENVLAMSEWIYSAGHAYGSDPAKAVLRGLHFAPDTVWLLSDGRFSPAIAKTIRDANAVQKAEINTVAFYSREGEQVMRQIAEENHGTYHFVPPPDKNSEVTSPSLPPTQLPNVPVPHAQ